MKLFLTAAAFALPSVVALAVVFVGLAASGGDAFAASATVTKTKHDTAKNAIGNIR